MLFGRRRLKEKEDVKRTERIAEMTRLILQNIHDEGGNDTAIGRIIEDAKASGRHDFTLPFIREAVGPIWELALKQTTLDVVDLATPIDPRDERVTVLPAVLEAKWEPPQASLQFGDAVYSLWHSREPYKVHDVEDLHFNNGRVVATLQELYWYVRRFGGDWLGHCRTIAAGSRSYEKPARDGWENRMGESSFPVAFVNNGNIVIDKTPVIKDIRERCFGPEYFYLVRNTRPDLEHYYQTHFGSCP